MKQGQDQEGFAQCQEQERFQFEAYQAKEFELFQNQQQAKSTGFKVNSSHKRKLQAWFHQLHLLLH